MTYDEMVRTESPRWVVVDLTTNEIIAEEWSWTYANIAAYDAEQERYMHAIRIYDRLNEKDYEIVETFN
jgi:hypothetical protein